MFVLNVRIFEPRVRRSSKHLGIVIPNKQGNKIIPRFNKCVNTINFTCLRCLTNISSSTNLSRKTFGNTKGIYSPEF